MPRTIMSCFLLSTTSSACVFAEVDQRPLDVQVVPAFPDLEWPDWVRGLDEGKPRDPRPLLLTGAGDGTNRIFVVSRIRLDPRLAERSERQRDENLPRYPRARAVRRPARTRKDSWASPSIPSYKENGEFFVYYSAKPTPENPHVTVISRFRVSQDDPNRADPTAKKSFCGLSTRTGITRAARLSSARTVTCTSASATAAPATTRTATARI